MSWRLRTMSNPHLKCSLMYSPFLLSLACHGPQVALSEPFICMVFTHSIMNLQMMRG